MQKNKNFGFTRTPILASLRRVFRKNTMPNLVSGFTLIELLVVISIIGMLSTIVLASLNSARSKARDAKRIADLRNISTALEFFYDSYGRYPVTNSHLYWDGHWVNFKTCLETGVGCWAGMGDNSSIANYSGVMRKVPNDPNDPTPDTIDNSATYYYSWNTCSDQMYVLRTVLENNNAVLNSDADGDYYTSGDSACNDNYLAYCIKVNWCH